MKGEVENSCLTNSSAKMGSKSSGVAGCLVFGFSMGNGALGRSAVMLYHWVGISFSESVIFLIFSMLFCKFECE